MRKKKTFFAILNLVKIISNFCIEIIIKIFAIEQFYKIRKNVETFTAGLVTNEHTLSPPKIKCFWATAIMLLGVIMGKY